MCRRLLQLWPLLLLPVTLSAWTAPMLDAPIIQDGGDSGVDAFDPVPFAAPAIPPPASRGFVGPSLPEELPWSTPPDAVRVAMTDAAAVVKLTPLDLLFTRWIWDQEGEAENIQAVSWVLNMTTQSPFIRQCPVAGGILVRVDLRWYFDEDIDAGLVLWEDFQFDPQFSRLVTKDTIDLFIRLGKQLPRHQVWQNKWRRDDERWRLKEHVLAVVDAKDVVVIRSNNAAVERAGLSKLQQATNSLAPIVSARHFVGRAFSAIKLRDKVKVDGKDVFRENLFSTVWGGRYYELTGTRVSQAKERTDLDQRLFDLGILERFLVLFERLKSDQRAALFRSKVTGKPRRIVWFPSLAPRLTEAMPVIMLTEDIRNRDVDHGKHAIKELSGEFKPAAFELLYNGANGTVRSAIFGDNEELLEFADANEIVADRLVPAPDTPTLDGGMISCARCHGPSDLWQPFVNDVNMLKTTRLDVFFDTSNLKQSEFQQISRLVGQYTGDAGFLLGRLREDAARTSIKATGRWKGQPFDNAARLAAARTALLFQADRNDDVDAAAALRSLGVKVKSGDGAAMKQFGELFPPDLRLANGKFVPEDAVIGGLAAGAKVRPFDWALSYSYALERIGK